MKKYFLAIPLLLIIISSFIFFVLLNKPKSRIFVYHSSPELYFWKFRSVDTMKYSRDLSREKVEDLDFDKTIDSQIKNISLVGANYVAIGTPYDKEFFPFLKKWVSAARKYNLKVWFRGNWSGWEKWFDYPKISSDEHIKKTKDFILANADIFEDGDIFSSCPECENGALGDPRQTGDVPEYRNFLIREYQAAKSAFQKIGKHIDANYFSMNGDVAKLVMDKKTTAALDGVVVIDHYVKTPEKLLHDIEDIARSSGGKVVLGEFGAPIPDIHGEMTEQEQAAWIRDALNLLANSTDLVGVNYWVNVGGTTEIWNDQLAPLAAVGVLEKFYHPDSAYGVVQDEFGEAIRKAEIYNSGRSVLTDESGYFEMAIAGNSQNSLKISAPGFIEKEISISKNSGQTDVSLIRKNGGVLYRFRLFLKKVMAK